MYLKGRAKLVPKRERELWNLNTATSSVSCRKITRKDTERQGIFDTGPLMTAATRREYLIPLGLKSLKGGNLASPSWKIAKKHRV